MRLCKFFLTLTTLLVFLVTMFHDVRDLKANDHQLQSVVIHLNSKRQLKQLRKYPLEIIRVRQDAKSNANFNSLDKPQIVEAVASSTVIDKLIQSGFEIILPSGAQKEPKLQE